MFNELINNVVWLIVIATVVVVALGLMKNHSSRNHENRLMDVTFRVNHRGIITDEHDNVVYRIFLTDSNDSGFYTADSDVYAKLLDGHAYRVIADHNNHISEILTGRTNS